MGDWSGCVELEELRKNAEGGDANQVDEWDGLGQTTRRPLNSTIRHPYT